MENITITTSLANTILQYLATRPYQEVYQIIAAMHEAAKPVQPTE
jgi:hypothetical protein